MSLRRSTVVLLACALLATAACGSRLSDEERALAISANATGTDGAGTTDGSVAEEATGDTTVDTVGGTTGESEGGGDGGTTGGGDGGGPAGPAACRPGSATSTGVTPTEIKVGNVSQISGLVPGFGQTGVNGVRAYFNMINTMGGVCGRKLTLVTADDRFQSATNRAETE